MERAKKTSGEAQPSPAPPKLWLTGVAAATIIGLMVTNWLYGRSLPATERGLFGDTFGAANALFSGLAFVGVVYAILLQRYEVAIAKADAATTKEILDDQSRHLETQIASERRRSFEDTFFKMLTLFAETIETVPFVERAKEISVHKGRYAIECISYEILRHNYMEARLELKDYEPRIQKFFASYGSSLGHYYRSLETLLSFIDASDVDRHAYARIVRGQLSDAEHAVIFHFCLQPRGSRLKELVERYSLLSDLKTEEIRFPELMDRFAATAFRVAQSTASEP